jgi:hypothetical protein
MPQSGFVLGTLVRRFVLYVQNDMVAVCGLITFFTIIYNCVNMIVVFVMLCVQGDALVVCWLRDVHSVLELRSLKTGDLVRDIPLPDIGSVSSFKGDRKSSEAFFSFTTFTDPGSDFRYDFLPLFCILLVCFGACGLLSHGMCC